MNFDLTKDQTLHKATDECFVADSGILALPVSAARGGLCGSRVELAAAMEAPQRGLVAEPVRQAGHPPCTEAHPQAGAGLWGYNRSDRRLSARGMGRDNI